MKRLLSFLIILIFITSCTKSYLKEKTVDEIRQYKKDGKPTSELDKCLMEANKDQDKYQTFIDQCIPKKLGEIKKGETTNNTDKVDCSKIKDDNLRDFCLTGQKMDEERTKQNEKLINELQKSEAESKCDKSVPEELKNRLTLLDCSALVSK